MRWYPWLRAQTSSFGQGRRDGGTHRADPLFGVGFLLSICGLRYRGYCRGCHRSGSVEQAAGVAAARTAAVTSSIFISVLLLLFTCLSLVAILGLVTSRQTF